MHYPDPSALTPDERRAEIAAILARGILRLRADGVRRHRSGPAQNSVTAGLDVGTEIRLTVDSGRETASSNEASRPGVVTTSPALTTTTL